MYKCNYPAVRAFNKIMGPISLNMDGSQWADRQFDGGEWSDAECANKFEEELDRIAAIVAPRFDMQPGQLLCDDYHYWHDMEVKWRDAVGV